MKTIITDIDPTGNYTEQGAPFTWCVEACGLLPSFVSVTSDDLLIDQMQEAYGFPTGTMGGLIIDGVYHSPYSGDEELYPYMSISAGEETVYIYPYGIVAAVFEKDGENTQLITRMD